jgi:hypothetical protein
MALITAVSTDRFTDRFAGGSEATRDPQGLYKTVRELLASFPFSFFLSFGFLYLELPIVQAVKPLC